MSTDTTSAPEAATAASNKSGRHPPRPCLVLCKERGWGPGTVLEGNTKTSYDVVEIVGFDAEGGAMVKHWTDEGDKEAPTKPKFFPLLYRDWQPIGDPVPFKAPSPATPPPFKGSDKGPFTDPEVFA